MNLIISQFTRILLFFLVIVLQSDGHNHKFNRINGILSRRSRRDRLLQGYESILVGKDLTSTTGFFGSNPRMLTGIKIDQEGKVSSFEIAKQQLASELLLPLRDLRIVDPSYPSQIQATVLARPNVILFSVDHVKIIIKHSEAFIFNVNHEEIRKFVSLLQQQLVVQSLKGYEPQRNEKSRTQNNDTHTLSEKDNQNEYSLSLTQQRFEHVVLETALSLISVTLSSEIRSLEPAVAAALLDLRVVSRGLDVIQTQVDELLPLKNKIDELRKRCMEIKQCIFEVLNSDEDMQMMFLETNLDDPETERQNESISEPKRRPKNTSRRSSSMMPFVKKLDHIHRRKRIRSTQSLETLLENYLNEVEWVTSEVDDLLNEITNTEENVVLQLDLIRNRILKFELYLSISSFVVTCGALVTGLFGMNLLNHFELDKKMFYVVSVLLFSSMVLGFRFFMKYARKQKLL